MIDNEGAAEPVTEDTAVSDDSGAEEMAEREAVETPREASFEPETQQEADQRRPTRAENKAARGRVFNENAELKRQLADLTRQMAAIGERTQRGFEELKPKPEDPRIKAKAEASQKFRQALASLDANDPDAVDKFREIVSEAGRADYEAMLDQKLAALRESMPQPDPPLVAKLKAEYPWLHEREAEVNMEMRRLQNTKYKGRDMSDQNFLYAVAREAAARVAVDWELPVEKQRDANAPQRLAGSSGRTGAGGPGGEGAGMGLSSETLSKIDLAAASLYPDPSISPEKKRAMWMANVKKNQPSVYKSIMGS